MKKVVTIILTIVMIAAMACPVFAINVDSFSDVPSGHWAYDAIMRMANMGILNGTTTPVNGVGTFEPNATMTTEAFIKCIVVYLNPNGNYQAADGESWSAPYIRDALANGYINNGEFSSYSIPMTREEMAMVLARVAERNGESASKLIDTRRIPDYNSVGNYYKEYVRIAYSLGLLCGVDNSGTFDPAGTLTRAQAATVIYRLIDPSTRPSVDLSDLPTDSGKVRYGGALVRGSFIPNSDPPIVPKGSSYDDANNIISDYIWEHYGYVYDNWEGQMHWGTVGEAGYPIWLVHREDGVLGVRIGTWSHADDFSVNMILNSYLYTLYSLCGDKEVATALWDLIDEIATGNDFDAVDFGFTIVPGTDVNNEIEQGSTMRMNNIDVTILFNKTMWAITYWFE